MEFLREHIGLKDPEVLFKSVIRTAAKLIEVGYFDKFKDAFYSACILVAFPFEGRDELTQEQLLKIGDQIVNDCIEYAKENGLLLFEAMLKE